MTPPTDTILTHPQLQHGWRRVKAITRTANGWHVETQEIGPDQGDRWERGPTLEITDTWVAQAEVLAAVKAEAEAEAATLAGTLRAAGAVDADGWSMTVAVTSAGLEVRTSGGRFSVAHHPDIVADVIASRAAWLEAKDREQAALAAAKAEAAEVAAIEALLDANPSMVSTRGGERYLCGVLVGEYIAQYSMDRNAYNHAQFWGYEARSDVTHHFCNRRVTLAEAQALVAAEKAAETAREAAQAAAAEAARVEELRLAGLRAAEIEAAKACEAEEARLGDIATIRRCWRTINTQSWRARSASNGGRRGYHPDALALLDRIEAAQARAEQLRAERLERERAEDALRRTRAEREVAEKAEHEFSGLGNAFARFGL